MPFDFNSFVNVGQFSDPANYSGFGGQMKSVKQVAQEAALASLTGAKPEGEIPNSTSSSPSVGVAPPQKSISDAFMDFGKQAIAPLQKQWDTVSQIGSDVSQGNYGNAANTLLGNKPQQFQNSYAGFKKAIDQHFGEQQ